MKKGSITIYLAMTLTVFLSLFVTVIEGARNRAVCIQAQCGLDLAVYSVFAEYNRELLSQYDLFFIDTSYGEKEGSPKRLKRHLDAYITENLSEGIFEHGNGTDLTKTFLERTDLTKISYATDAKGKVFERQAIGYMKHKYGISYLEDIKKELKTVDEKELLTKDISGPREENQSVIDEAKENGIATGEVDENGEEIRKEISLDNPADTVNGNRSKGILALVTKPDAVLSDAAVDMTAYVSHRKPGEKGNGLAGRDGISYGESLFFDAYILEKCGNYTAPKKEGVLWYQAEYILAGKNNDIDNLKTVVRRLLLLREVSNVTFLFSDASKVSEAAGLATSICTAAGAPVLIEPVKITLLFAWAYAEAIYDTRCLLEGERIPLIKSQQSWHYSLQGMLSAGQDSLQSAPEGSMTQSVRTSRESEDGSALMHSGTLWEDGLSYSDYLRIFLATSSEQQKIDHMMDIVEMDVRKASHHIGFCMDNCVDYICVEACVGSKYGYSQELEREFYYE